MASLQLKLLGGFTACLAGGQAFEVSGKKNQALLAYLALSRGKKLSREKLVGLLWSDRGDTQARSSLRQALVALRHDLAGIEPAPLNFEGDTVAIVPSAVSTDVAEFERLAASNSVDELRQAVGLYEGDLLDGFVVRDPAFDEWLSLERGRLREIAIGVLSGLLVRVRGPEAATIGSRLISLDPMRESSHRALMHAYATQGELDQAVRQYQACRKILRDDLQVEPSPEMENLYRAISEGRYKSRIDAEPSAPSGVAVSSAGSQATLPLPDRPSIVVLPFANMSGDATHDYFADGITENIITGLSRFRDLFVIARHSAFAYKDKAAKIEDVCRELGVHYVLEGSVQRSSDRVRVTAQLIDGLRDRHLWAERYDRKVEDIFAVQDEVTEMIVGTLATSYGGRLRKAWSARPERAGPRSFQAIDHFQLGMDFLNRFNEEDNKRACEFFSKAAELDPGYAKPCAKIAWSHMIDVQFGWSENPAASLASALESATEAIRRDDDEAWGHWALGGYYLIGLRQYDRAIAELQKGVELNPNDADVITDLAWCLNYAGRSREALEWALKAMRLNPHHPAWYIMQLGQIYYDARCYEEAIATFRSLSTLDTVPIELWLAASHAALGHPGEAQNALKRVLELDPQATIARWVNPERFPYKEARDLEHFRAGLREAGLSE